ncbi:glycosyltransferase [Priestia megaterium]|uniref:Glycosyltransferase n=2 Tax=Priestia megaterium TaxID=1404 RepID=A0AAX6BFS5_PRIMG|nr:glycosyltransferase [Priestia megaterium]
MLREATPLWKDKGIASSILSTGNSIGIYAEELQSAGYKVTHIPFYKNFKHFWEFYKFVKSNRFDVVHIHTERANIFYSILAKLAKTKRIIRTIHSMFKFKGLLKIRKIIERFVVRLLGVQQVSIGNVVEQNESEQYHNQTQVVFNWIDTSKFKFIDKDEKLLHKNNLGIPYQKFVVLSIGNCSEVKNHTEIFKTIKELVNEGIYKDILYLHIGKEDICQTERKLAIELGIQEYVKFIGFAEDVRPFLYASDLFIMPSLYEGFGIAGLEALSTGLPCIFSDNSGLLEFKPYMQEVFYVQPTYIEIKKCVEKFIVGNLESNYERRKKNVAVAKQKYDVHIGAKKYINLYEGT